MNWYLGISLIVGIFAPASMWMEADEQPKWWQAIGGMVVFGLLWPLLLLVFLVEWWGL